LDAKMAHAEADRAADAYDHAHTQALISNVMFGVGAAAVAAGAVWLVVALGSDGGSGDEAAPPQAMLTPSVAPGRLGLTLHGSL
jgi:predicted type IV restriction endonuclease